MYLFQVDIGELLPVLNFKELSIVGVLLGIIFYLIKEKTALKNEIKAKDNKIDEIALKKGYRDYETKFTGYTATAFFSDTKIRGDEYSTEMIQVLNKDLDVGLTEPSVEGPKGLWDSIYNARSRRVEVTAEFTPKDILDIKDTDPEVVKEISERHGIKESAINEMIEKIEKISNKKFKKNYQLDKPKGVRGRSSNNDLIRKLLKWEPKYNLSEGLKKTYQWIEEDIKKKRNQ